MDLEGTLLSNAVSQIPRPHLYWFLDSCKSLFERIVIFTCISESRFRKIATLLVLEGHAPLWFEKIEYIHWSGPKKDLSFIPEISPSEALILDDLAEYILSDQTEQWIKADHFNYKSSELDDGLTRAFTLIKEKIQSNT